MRRFGVVVATALVLVTSACGGDGRPSADELSKSLRDGSSAMGDRLESLDKKQVDCVAKAFVDSDLSDEALNALVEGDEDFEGSDKDEKALEGMEDEVKACAEKG